MGSASRFGSCSLLFYVLLVAQCTHINSSRGSWKDVDKQAYNLQQTTMDDHIQILAKQTHDDHDNDHDHDDLSYHIFFTINDLKVGKKIPLYFSIKDPSTSPPLLPRAEADSIPFSSSQLPQLLQFLSFSKDSPQAKAMQQTLHQCELQPLDGETKFCSTSFESMLDFTRSIFGTKTQFKVLTTKLLSKHTSVLQNYTVLEVPQALEAVNKMVACHAMPYPYKVFYCHCQEGDHQRVFEVLLGGENGERVEAVGVCHMDTSQWNDDHVAFRVLGIRPGGSPVCHVFPTDNLIWVA